MSEKRFSYKGRISNDKINQPTEFTRQVSKIKQQISQQSESNNDNPSEDNTDNSITYESCLSWFKSPKVKYFLLAWLFFLIAFLVYILIWVIGHLTIERLSSNYYFNDFNISPYANIQFWKVSNRALNNNNITNQKYIKSNSLYQRDELKKVDAIALSLFFSWLMWKLPLTVFTLKMIRNKKKNILKYSTYGSFLIFLLLIDIMVTAFTAQTYKDWIFFIIYVCLSIVLIVINYISKKQRHKLYPNLKSYLIVITYIVFIYVFMTIAIPSLYGAIYSSLYEDTPYLIVYIFPLIDLVFYFLIIIMTYSCQPHTIKFIKMFYFVNTGYIVGHLLLFSPDQVQFYFLVTYLAIRNISTNWIVQMAQKYLINPAPLFGWIIIYLVSLAVNFIPFTGIGSLVVSKSFYSQILQITLPIIRYTAPGQYYIYSASNLPEIGQYNTSLYSNTQISAVFIIWVILTITQKYHISKPQFKQIFFYVFGIYLFYFGLTTGLQLQYLQMNNI